MSLPPGYDPSRLGVFWHWFGRPFRIVPKTQRVLAPDRDGGLFAVSWLGTQTTVFWGRGAQLACERLRPAPD